MTKTFKVSEIFLSLEGEGPHNSRPTMYIRFGQCNLKCPMFNNHNGELADSGYAALSFNPKDYTSLQDIPLITKGCDSQYAVNPEFSHMWVSWTVDEIVDEMIRLLPHNSWVHPVTGLPVILSLTGGEPMLQAKWFQDILQHPKMVQLKHVLVETNCTVPVSSKVGANIVEWLRQDSSRRWTWSNSPKLSASGEHWDVAIKPAVAISQMSTLATVASQVEQYFKFVVEPTDVSFAEVKQAMDQYFASGVDKTVEVWLMPAACTTEQQNDIAQAVAVRCMNDGYLFCYRLQNALWGNGVGT